jgi:hypothetical protein
MMSKLHDVVSSVSAKSTGAGSGGSDSLSDPLTDPTEKSRWDDIRTDVGNLAGGGETETALGTTLARRMDKVDQIGDPKTYMSTPEIDAHLSKFKTGGHAFISEWVHGQIMKAKDAGGWGGWGKDANFVAPLSEANALVDEAKASNGIATIEERLGIPEGNWRSPKKVLYRYILKNPSKFGLRMASGKESGAYKDEWVAGGNTLGGASEAVVNSLGLVDLQTAVADGSMEVKEEAFPTTPDVA